jgi:hypothetical protein
LMAGPGPELIVNRCISIAFPLDHLTKQSLPPS